MFDKISTGKATSLPIIIKADVQGSAEAIENSITKLSTEETALANQATMGEPLRLPAGVLTGPIGEPQLEGDVILTLTTVVKGETIGAEGRALGGGSSSAFFDPREGEYLVVIYTVKNNLRSKIKIPADQVDHHQNASFGS